ncbi:hypothetical protein D7Y13_02585 [Corallococcus praedator]|uniref:Dienelactone hydrolase domain-containing protein n=1 Tax=Corallococcus praedator TaxID=2316724 RepID=A0ABX9QT42_9BACT|nr:MULTISPECIES: alpha/beta fold hydrolase [Corallococcus]RKH35239.1 hypothetical protein D7X75_04930 [Corallococcus sp. CA031C]RKI16431.1 hypothetical protein D7Y13_02585 [Corallococcus praedator]
MQSEQRVMLADAPALIVGGGPTPAPGPRGTVVLLHGLGASKEVQRPEAYLLARRGYVAVILDAVGHGERRHPDFEHRFAPERMADSFAELVAQAAAELPTVLGVLAEQGWSRPGAVGACGISMGGAMLFGAIEAGAVLDAAVSVVAPPPRAHAHLARYFPTPLLLQTAGADTLVPASNARAFHHALTPRYASAPERLRFVEHDGEGHMFSEAGWGRVWDEALGWFDRFLPAAGAGGPD